jgi:hypothetical protein
MGAVSRYVSRPRSGLDYPRIADWVSDPMLPHISVDGEKQVDTGLVDAKGNPIVRLQGPIGFRK